MAINRKKRKILLYIMFSMAFTFVLFQLFFNITIDNNNHDCQKLNIHSVSSEFYSLHINFLNDMNFEDIKKLSSQFIIITEAFDKPMILLSDSILNITKHSSRTYIFKYEFPFVMNYSCSFQILENRPKFDDFDFSSFKLKPIISYKIDFIIDKFDTDRSESQLECYGNNSLTRWCEMRRVAYLNTRLVFYTHALYSFPSPFLSIGCRAPPFDIVEDRLYDEPIISHTPVFTSKNQEKPFENENDKFMDENDIKPGNDPQNENNYQNENDSQKENNSKKGNESQNENDSQNENIGDENDKTVLSDFNNLEYIPDVSYMIGRFFNSMMLWHVMFDFIIAAYWTIMKIEGNFYNPNRRVFIRDSQEVVFWNFISILSQKEIKNIKNDPTPCFFERVIVGLPKFEKEPNEKRNIDEMASFNYYFDDDVAIGLREAILNELGITVPEINNENPTIVFVSRGKSSSRDITNTENVIELMKKTCRFCKIRKVLLHQLSIKDQVELISQTSVLIGVHGSGLTHTMWLPRSNKTFNASLIEILPYKYWCRDWYKTAAKVAGVNYYSVMNTGRILPDIMNKRSFKNWRCYGKPELCTTLECNDYLKDQSFELELDTFNETWLQVVEILKNNRKNQ
ncbi:hypothetical protein TRFO_21018 [Tritrichomonas foetus]|uniref:Glycosyltransferase 61 catalytic domain-containing protein n=1 Tax=Tritrichomonas foetus TaxID=1144522 RepID=A0A1J4KJD3_9EUKA|nr:hypothetical protein TRFO_21018 [Tritrichomonas foetus]|eukprot:OHT09932.1 hypothetical protein TRFO_21018 [Tritrichomonas foetus]